MAKVELANWDLRVGWREVRNCDSVRWRDRNAARAEICALFVSITFPRARTWTYPDSSVPVSSRNIRDSDQVLVPPRLDPFLDRSKPRLVLLVLLAELGLLGPLEDAVDATLSDERFKDCLERVQRRVDRLPVELELSGLGGRAEREREGGEEGHELCERVEVRVGRSGGGERRGELGDASECLIWLDLLDCSLRRRPLDWK